MLSYHPSPEGRKQHPSGHGRAIAWALRADSGGCGLPIYSPDAKRWSTRTVTEITRAHELSRCSDLVVLPFTTELTIDQPGLTAGPS
eukprot:4684136-Prymnesium_polylepis.1